MITIREAQMRAFGGDAGFVHALEAKLPDIPENEVRDAVQRARVLGITRESDVARYAAIASAFPDGRVPPRIEKLLGAKQVAAAERLDRAEQWLKNSGRSIPDTSGFGSNQVGDPVYPCRNAPPPLPDHWVEIVLIGEDDSLVAWEQYSVKAPGLDRADGLLDSDGFTRVGLPTGADVEVSFPRLDREAWEPLGPVNGTRSLPPEGNAENRRVEPGDGITSIGFESGFFPDTLWNLAENADLAKKRDEPDALYPGDIVFVPALRPKEVIVAADKRHRFRRLGVPAKFEIQLFRGELPRANEPYRLIVDGHEKPGTTDGNGNLCEWVPPDIREGTLIVGTDRVRYQLQFGYLDPADEITGIQQRLRNLGFDSDDEEGTLGASTQAALRAFQRRFGLKESGEPDPATVRTLKDMHDYVNKFPPRPPMPLPPPEPPQPMTCGPLPDVPMLFFIDDLDD